MPSPYDTAFPWKQAAIAVAIIAGLQLLSSFIDGRLLELCVAKTCSGSTAPMMIDGKCVCLEVPR